MKPLIWLAAVAPWAWMLAPKPEEPLVLVVGGDLDGYLSPCGCVKPMQGGIRRWASAVRKEGAPERVVLLFNGGVTAGTDRQQALKGETVAEMLGELSVDALNVGFAEARLGAGYLETLTRLTKERLISSSVTAPALQAEESVRVGPFAVFAVDGQPSRVAKELGGQASPLRIDASSGVPVLMVQGTRDQALSLLKDHPSVKILIYRSTEKPPSQPEKVGDTWLLTPGHEGKVMVRAEWHEGSLVNYRVVALGPEVPDDPKTAALFRTYLTRVTQEKLLDQLPRTAKDAFAGSKVCQDCHPDAHDIWQNTAHAGALKTLENEGQDRDPDCVSCHVVGLDSTKGFMSRKETPDLASVGCESCHGPSADHVKNPYEIKPPARARDACMKCHTPGHSPGFNFDSYWPRIQH